MPETKQETFTLECSVGYDKKSESFVSYCRDLNTFSAGSTRDEAVAALFSAISMKCSARLEGGHFGLIVKMLGLKEDGHA